jgi:hypothetical protein
MPSWSTLHVKTAEDDWRLERLIYRLPARIRSAVRWVRQPSRRWLRIPVGSLLTVGGNFGFLSLVGFWMLPLGVALLADDVPPLRLVRSRILNWVEGHHPHWIENGVRS